MNNKGSFILDALVASAIIATLIVTTASFSRLNFTIQSENNSKIRAIELIGNELEYLKSSNWVNIQNRNLNETIRVEFNIATTVYNTQQLRAVFHVEGDRTYAFIIER